MKAEKDVEKTEGMYRWAWKRAMGLRLFFSHFLWGDALRRKQAVRIKPRHHLANGNLHRPFPMQYGTEPLGGIWERVPFHTLVDGPTLQSWLLLQVAANAEWTILTFFTMGPVTMHFVVSWKREYLGTFFLNFMLVASGWSPPDVHSVGSSSSLLTMASPQQSSGWISRQAASHALFGCQPGVSAADLSRCLCLTGGLAGSAVVSGEPPTPLLHSYRLPAILTRKVEKMSLNS